MRLTLNGNQYLDLIRDTSAQARLPKSATIEVSDSFTVPKAILVLPSQKTVFQHSLESNGNLSSFNHIVKGNAYFDGGKLQAFGSRAKFLSSLYAGNTKLSEFNNSVGGLADLRGIYTLVTIGPKAKFGGALYVAGSSLLTFDNEVQGIASFVTIDTLTSFGPNVKFHKDLFAAGTGITEFNHVVAGNASFLEAAKLSVLGPKAKFGKNLSLEGTSITYFDHEVGGTLNLSHLLDEEVTLGPNAKFGELIHEGTRIRREMPELKPDTKEDVAVSEVELV